MKSYRQACGLAKALDVVGDRWSLLIVRELLIRGAGRYTDLRRGLPGIASNLLVERLKELETAGVLQRTAAPAPIATDLFSLTERGRALEPALMLLGLWGAPLLAESTGEDDFQAHWMVLPLRGLLRSGPEARVAVHVDGEIVAITADKQGVDVGLRPQSNPTVVVEGPSRAVFNYLAGKSNPAVSARAGVTVQGDREALAALIPSPRDRMERLSANSPID